MTFLTCLQAISSTVFLTYSPLVTLLPLNIFFCSFDMKFGRLLHAWLAFTLKFSVTVSIRDIEKENLAT